MCKHESLLKTGVAGCGEAGVGKQRVRASPHLAQEGVRPRPHGARVDESRSAREGTQGTGGGAEADRYSAAVLPDVRQALHDGGTGVFFVCFFGLQPCCLPLHSSRDHWGIHVLTLLFPTPLVQGPLGYSRLYSCPCCF